MLEGVSASIGEKISLELNEVQKMQKAVDLDI